MYEFDCDDIEDVLDLEVPCVLRDFLESLEASGKHPSCCLIPPNNDEIIRENMAKADLDKWQEHFLVFGHDGSEKTFFMIGEEDSDEVFAYSLDPPGIESEGDAMTFFGRTGFEE